MPLMSISIKFSIYSAGRHAWCLVYLTGTQEASIYNSTISMANCNGASGLFYRSSNVQVS